MRTVPEVAADDSLSADQDQKEAKRVLAEAGYAEGFTFTALSATIDPFPRSAEMIQAMLAEVGITMEIQQVEAAQVADLSYAQNTADTLFAAFPGNPDPLITIGQRYMPEGFYNRQGVSSPALTELCTEALATTDEAARTELLKQMSVVISEEALDVPIVPSMRPYVEGYQHPVSAVPEFRDIRVLKE